MRLVLFLMILAAGLLTPAASDRAAAAPADVYYLAPDGSDAQPGTTAAQPWQTFGHALPRLTPGDTLVLLDGTYTPERNGRFLADGFAEGADRARSGTRAQPITVRAQHERQAHIAGDGLQATLLLENLAWWRLEGLRASSRDNAAAERGGEGVKLINTQHIEIRRGLFHNNNRYRNAQMLMIVLSREVLVEESEIYHFHRNGFEAYRSEGVTFRRCYANSRGHADLPEGRGSHGISQDGGDRAFVGYYVSDLLVENSISENKTEGFGFISGLPTNVVDAEALAGDPPDELQGYPPAYYARIEEDAPRTSGDRARFLGVVSRRDNIGGAVQSRERAGSSQPIRNVRFENFLLFAPYRQGFISRAGRDVTMNHVTVLNASAERRWDGEAFALSTDRQGQWPSCAAIGGCTYRLGHWLAAYNEGAALADFPAGDAPVDVQVEYSNFYQNGGLGVDEDLGDAEGAVRHGMAVRPTKIGAEEGECLVFVPAGSSMKGAGHDGADVGATVLYRYQDGRLTDEPLWDPETGAFPHGAVVDGLNDQAGASAFDVHERLNVNTNGCRLPYANASASSPDH